jgi:hypothetical protein
MPLTEKGQEIHAAMTKAYGEKKGEEVFYASKNAGTISGVDDIVDNSLNWNGGEHLSKPSGPGDKPIPPEAAKASGVMDAGEFGRNMSAFLGQPVLPRVLGTSSGSDPIAVVDSGVKG